MVKEVKGTDLQRFLVPTRYFLEKMKEPVSNMGLSNTIRWKIRHYFKSYSTR